MLLKQYFIFSLMFKYIGMQIGGCQEDVKPQKAQYQNYDLATGI
jgi:hypothetical protein